MQEQMMTDLMRATFEVLETVYFVCPEPLAWDPDEAEGFPGEICTEIVVGGENSKKISLRFSEQLLRMMACNILERDQVSFQREELLDLAKETTNIVAGTFIRRVGNVPDETLTIPQVASGPEKAGERKYYEVEGEPLGVSLLVEP